MERSEGMGLADTIEGMFSDDWLDRVKAEYEQTMIRYAKLHQLQETDQDPILRRQSNIMAQYLRILYERIEAEENRRKQALEDVEARR